MHVCVWGGGGLLQQTTGTIKVLKQEGLYCKSVPRGKKENEEREEVMKGRSAHPPDQEHDVGGGQHARSERHAEHEHQAAGFRTHAHLS